MSPAWIGVRQRPLARIESRDALPSKSAAALAQIEAQEHQTIMQQMEGLLMEELHRRKQLEVKLAERGKEAGLEQEKAELEQEKLRAEVGRLESALRTALARISELRAKDAEECLRSESRPLEQIAEGDLELAGQRDDGEIEQERLRAEVVRYQAALSVATEERLQSERAAELEREKLQGEVVEYQAALASAVDEGARQAASVKQCLVELQKLEDEREETRQQAKRRELWRQAQLQCSASGSLLEDLPPQRPPSPLVLSESQQQRATVLICLANDEVEQVQSAIEALERKACRASRPASDDDDNDDDRGDPAQAIRTGVPQVDGHVEHECFSLNWFGTASVQLACAFCSF